VYIVQPSMLLKRLSEALAQEVEQFGIKITIIEPGYFRTEFLSQDSVQIPDNPMP
jgi:short-subunit dehydrogenase